MHGHHYIGIEVGGTTTRVGVVAGSGEVYRKQVFPTRRDDASGMLQSIYSIVYEMWEEALTSGLDVAGIGMAVAGAVEHGILIRDLRIGLADSDLREFLHSFGLQQTVLVNDAVAQACAESAALSNVSETLVYLTFGSGVGGAILLRGKPYIGRRFPSALGHMVLSQSGPVCLCGGRGCLEALVGGDAIMSTYGVSAQTLLEERPQKAAVFEIVGYIGQAIASLTRIFDPDRIVLGGGLMRSYDRFRDSLIRTVGELLSEPVRNGLVIEVSRLGDDAGLVGIARILSSPVLAELLHAQVHT
jgi:predicted NBD/HSP70 family sugar kinase